MSSSDDLREKFGSTQIEMLRVSSMLEVSLDYEIVEWLGGPDRDTASTDAAVIARKVFIRLHVLPAFGFSGKVDLFAAIVRDHIRRADLAAKALEALRVFNTNRNMVVHGHYWDSKAKGPHLIWDRRGKATRTPITDGLLDGLTKQAGTVFGLLFDATQALRPIATEMDRRNSAMSRRYEALLDKRDDSSDSR